VAIPVVFGTGSLYPFGLDRIYGWAVKARYGAVEIMREVR
jgi:hypothetical protein